MQLSAPLTPVDCDLRDFHFLPLDVVRLRDSSLAAKADGEAFRCAVLLWCAAWHQVPAASLPDDDDVLAQLAGFGRVKREWMRHREGALYGWVKCTDGRLYHPVVATKANEAWRGKVVQRWKTECARVKKHNQRHETNHVVPDFDEWVSLGCPQGQQLTVSRTIVEDEEDKSGGRPGHPPDVPRETHSKGKGKGYLKEKDIAAAALDPPASDPVDNSPPPSDTQWIAAQEETAAGYAALLNDLENVRGKRSKFVSTDGRLSAWETLGLSRQRLVEAYHLAVADRDAQGDSSPINAGFLDVFVGKVLDAPDLAGITGRPFAAAKTADPLAWATSASAITAKGAALGIEQHDGEIFPAFKARVIEAAGLTSDDIARLRVDFGVHV